MKDSTGSFHNVKWRKGGDGNAVYYKKIKKMFDSFYSGFP